MDAASAASASPSASTRRKCGGSPAPPEAITGIFVARETARGVAARRIVLAGFSQGGAIALYTGQRRAERLAGIVALSTYLIDGAGLAAEASPANRDVPVFIAHGRKHAVVQ